MMPEEKFNSLREKLLSHIGKVDASRCWEWSGTKNRAGYGYMWWGATGGRLLSHRVAWEVFCGPIAHGVSVLHKCDNPGCCNPDHLFLGTQADNMRDCWKKGRHKNNPLSGEHNGTAKLTEQQVAEIKWRANNTTLSNVRIGKLYGVSETTIRNIKFGRQWGWVEAHQ